MNRKTIIKNNNQQRQIIRFTVSVLALAASVAVAAQSTAPDAGTTISDLAPTTQLPVASPTIGLQGNTVTQAASGGAVIVVQQNISFIGNSQFTSAALNAVLVDAPGKSYDLAGLQGLTNRITAHYRSHGFAVARALLPVQPMTDGALIIEIIEGRYGSIKATGDNIRSADAQAFLSDLRTGDIIRVASLERAALILSDQPGFKTTPILSPGKAVGTGDLEVNAELNKRYSGEIGLDNHGNRYMGDSRIHLDLDINSSFFFGDQFKVRGLASDGNMLMDGLNYSLPLGGSGLRGNVGYTHTYYELGEEFSSSKTYGTAKVSSAGLSYPIIRSELANLSVAATYHHKDLNNSEDITFTSYTNSSDSLPFSFKFDISDQVGGGGTTYGVLSMTQGVLTLASANQVDDSTSARTAGDFNKTNLDFARLQSIPGNYTLLVRVSAQWADKNLDSSEKFSLGGANGVRAYPIGEAYGDEGNLIQLEMRYQVNDSTFYLFYDTGTITINHTAYAAGTNERSLAGNGWGFRFDTTYWSVDASTAWSTTGTFSDENQANRPTTWMSAKYKF
jgi:hemolysin activation/secretion protein